MRAEDGQKAAKAKKESKQIDFKAGLDINSRGDWCELIKDIVAMANSGGGMILIGVDDDGNLSGFDVTPILSYDSAKVVDKISMYTHEQFNEFEITSLERDGQQVAVFYINSVTTPMVFSTEGTYQTAQGKPKMAFAKGTTYFRHGAKSEPGNTNDLRSAIEREVVRVRKSWFANIRKVAEAPAGYRVSILPPETRIIRPKTNKILPPEIKAPTQLSATAVRVTTDPSAPAYRLLRPDQTHPHRMKNILRIINQRLGAKKITQHTILCLRKVYTLENRPDFYYKSQFTSPQYSDLFIEWLIAQYKNNPLFFEEVITKCKA